MKAQCTCIRMHIIASYSWNQLAKSPFFPSLIFLPHPPPQPTQTNMNA